MWFPLISRFRSRYWWPSSSGWWRSGPGDPASWKPGTEWYEKQRWQRDCVLQVENAHWISICCLWGEESDKPEFTTIILRRWHLFIGISAITVLISPAVSLKKHETLFLYALQDIQFKDQMVVSNLTSGKYRFQLTVTDTIGQSDSTDVKVLVLTPEQSEREYLVWKKMLFEPSAWFEHTGI